jgi:hypothetical protein
MGELRSSNNIIICQYTAIKDLSKEYFNLIAKHLYIVNIANTPIHLNTIIKNRLLSMIQLWSRSTKSILNYKKKSLPIILKLKNQSYLI